MNSSTEVTFFQFLIFIVVFSNLNCAVSQTDDSNLFDKSCNNRDFIIISTVDGRLTAVDINTGKKCWSVILDQDKLISSSLSNFETYNNDGRRVHLVPSLDGGLYKYDNDKKSIQLLPVDVDSLVSHTAFLDSSTSVIGGKIKVMHAINRSTGEILYTCGMESCNKFYKPIPSDSLVVEELIQFINAIDSSKADLKWHFRVAELKIRLSSQPSDSAFYRAKTENGLIPHSYSNYVDLEYYRVSLQNGYAGMINETTQDFAWLFKVSSPINDAWYLKGDKIKVLDPFKKHSGFFSVDMDDGYSTLLFLGIYQDQMFIKRSRNMQIKNEKFTSLSKDVLYQTYFMPVCTDISTKSLPPVHDQEFNTTTTAVTPRTIDYNVSDHGSYYYMNYSIFENSTHCTISSSTTIIYQEYNYVILRWYYYYIPLIIIICLCVLWLYFHDQKREYINASTCYLTSPSTLEAQHDFTSRFYQDFELISVLGKGGFGVVLDAKNKIDDCHYAVKRICLQEQLNDVQLERVLREVKALAKLDHHGIVRYFNAWIEHPPAGWQERKDMESNIKDISDSSASSMSSEKGSEKSSKSEVPSKPKYIKRLKDNPLKLSDIGSFSDNLSSLDRNVREQSSSFGSDYNVFGSHNLLENKETSSDSNDDSDSTRQGENEVSCVSSSYKCDNYDEDSFIVFEDSKNVSSLKTNNTSQLIKSFENSYNGYCEVGDFSDNLSSLDQNVREQSSSFGSDYNVFNSHNLQENKETSSDSNDDSDSTRQGENEVSCVSSSYKCDNYDEDSFIVFEDSKYVSSLKTNNTSQLIKSFENSYNGYCELRDLSISFIIPEQHLKCSDTLRSLNKLLINPLNQEVFHKFCCFIFYDLPASEGCTLNMLNWENVACEISKEGLLFYQKWLICILCQIRSPLNDFLCNVAVRNICCILSAIDKQLDSSNKSTKSRNNGISLRNEEEIELSSSKEDSSGSKKTVSEGKYQRIHPRGYLYIQMQLCQKESLRKWLNKNSTHREYNKVMEIFGQIVDAVHYVHNCGLMHRDLKPSNIYFSLEGAVKIGDFGLATSSDIHVENSSNSQSLSDIHTSDIGTELYMSPEQKLKQDYDFKTDIYSLGVIFYELLVPFKTYSERCKVLFKVRECDFPKEFKRDFKHESEFLKLLLDKNPKDRPTTDEVKKHHLLQNYVSPKK